MHSRPDPFTREEIFHLTGGDQKEMKRIMDKFYKEYDLYLDGLRVNLENVKKENRYKIITLRIFVLSITMAFFLAIYGVYKESSLAGIAGIIGSIGGAFAMLVYNNKKTDQSKSSSSNSHSLIKDNPTL